MLTLVLDPREWRYGLAQAVEEAARIAALGYPVQVGGRMVWPHKDSAPTEGGAPDSAGKRGKGQRTSSSGGAMTYPHTDPDYAPDPERENSLRGCRTCTHRSRDGFEAVCKHPDGPHVPKIGRVELLFGCDPSRWEDWEKKRLPAASDQPTAKP
jgi:hypothetical protein